MRIAHRAMENLPETPVIAAGLNIRCQGSQEDELLKPLIDATELRWDPQFVQAGYPLSRREITWVVDWQDGKISVNLVRDQHDHGLRLNLNFERSGNRDDLIPWVARPEEEVRVQVQRIFTDVLNLQMEAAEWIR